MKTEECIQHILKNIGENPKREGLAETPKRVAQMHQEIFSGYKTDPRKVIKAFDAEGYQDLVLVKNIEYYSMCEHHIIPFFGVVHIAYLPNKKITGLSKLPRLVDVFAKRLQNQERLTQQIAETIQKELKPRGVAVLVTGRHLCMHARGVQQTKSEAITTCFLGEFKKEDDLRQDFYAQIKI